jgi:hypothetical protein
MVDGVRARALRPDRRLFELYRLRWDLADLAVYVRGFRARRAGDANDIKAWSEMQRLVEGLVEGGARPQPSGAP